VLLNNKFGVTIGICNQLSVGWGYYRTKNIIMKNTYTKKFGVSKKKRRKIE